MRGEWVGKRRLGRTGETAAGTVGGGLLACAVLASVGGCGSADTGVLVELKNVPARSDRIALKTTLEGKPPTSVDVQELTASGLSRFGLSVPSSSSGRLVVDLQALDGDRCNQGSASVAVTLRLNEPPATNVPPAGCVPIAGAVVSIVTAKSADTALALPAVSEAIALKRYPPSGSVVAE